MYADYTSEMGIAMTEQAYTRVQLFHIDIFIFRLISIYSKKQSA